MQEEVNNGAAQVVVKVGKLSGRLLKAAVAKVKNLRKMGVPEDLAWQAGNSRRGYWFTTQTVAVAYGRITP